MPTALQHVAGLLGTLGVAVAGFGVAWILGYLVLAAWLGDRFERRDAIILAPVAFFLWPLAFFVTNALLRGAILGSWIWFFALFLPLFALHVHVARARLASDVRDLASLLRRWWRGTRLPRNAAFWGGAALAGFILVTGLLPARHGIVLDGDGMSHVQYCSQFYAGYTTPHQPPYDVAHGFFYPFLSHASIAFMGRLVGGDVFTGYLLVHAIQSILLPLGSWLVGRRISGSNSCAWIAAALTSVVANTGGMRSVAAERIGYPHISRSLAYALFVWAVYTILRRADWKGAAGWLLPGIVTGLVGLTHSYPFLGLGTFIVVRAALAMKQPRDVLRLAVIGVTSVAIAGLNVVPNLLAAGGAVAGGKAGFGDTTFAAESLTTFFSTGTNAIIAGAALFGVAALLRTAHARCLLALLLAMVALVVMARWKATLAWRLDMATPYHPTHKRLIGLFSLMTALLAAGGFWWFGRLVLERAGRWRAAATALCLVLFAAAIGRDVGVYLAYVGQKVGDYEAKVAKMKQYRQPGNVFELARDETSPSAVIAFETDGSETFATLSGTHVLYSKALRAHTPARHLANEILYAVGDERDAVARHAGVDYETVLAAALRDLAVTHVFVREKRAESLEGLPFLERQAEGYYRKPLFALLRVDRAQLAGVPDEAFSGATDRLLLDWVGVTPLEPVAVVQPEIRSPHDNVFLATPFRGLAVTGDDDVWGVIPASDDLVAPAGPDRIVRLDAATGRRLQEITAPASLHAGLAWDGALLHLLDAGGTTIQRIDPESGEVVATTLLEEPGLRTLAFDGDHLWSAHPASKRLVALDAANATVMRSIRMAEEPLAVACSAGFLWVATADARVGRFDLRGIGESGPRWYAGPPIHRRYPAMTAAPDGLWVTMPRKGILVRLRPRFD